MSYSVNECHRNLDEWKRKAQEAAKEIEWWAKELQMATERETKEARDKADRRAA